MDRKRHSLARLSELIYYSRLLRAKFDGLNECSNRRPEGCGFLKAKTPMTFRRRSKWLQRTGKPERFRYYDRSDALTSPDWGLVVNTTFHDGNDNLIDDDPHLPVEVPHSCYGEAVAFR